MNCELVVVPVSRATPRELLVGKEQYGAGHRVLRCTLSYNAAKNAVAEEAPIAKTSQWK